MPKYLLRHKQTQIVHTFLAENYRDFVRKAREYRFVPATGLAIFKQQWGVFVEVAIDEKEDE